MGKRNKLSADDMNVYVQYAKESTITTKNPWNWHSEVAGYNVNTQMSIWMSTGMNNWNLKYSVIY